MLNIRTIFTVPMAAIMCLNAALVLWVSVVSADAYFAEQQALLDVRLLRNTLSAQEMLSRERGPTNAALGAALPVGIRIVENLQKARLASDAALSLMLEAIVPGSGDRLQAPATNGPDTVRDRLRLARAEIDHLLALPNADRSYSRIDGAVHAMIALIPPFSPITAHLTMRITSLDPELAPSINVARAAADLRELAGRIGSLFTASLSTNTPFSNGQIGEIQQLLGQMQELRRQIAEHPIVVSRADGLSQLTAAHAAMEHDYFAVAQSLLEHVMTTGLSNGQFDLDAAGFASHYVPMMDSILSVRDTALGIAAEIGESKQESLRWNLLLAGAIGVLSLTIVVLSALSLNGLVVVPMLNLASQVQNLITGDRSVPIRTNTRTREIVAIAKVVERLRYAAAMVKTLDAEAEADRSRRQDRLRNLEMPLLDLERGARSLCDLAARAKLRLGMAAERLLTLGPHAALTSDTLLQATCSIGAETGILVDAEKRLGEVIQAIRAHQITSLVNTAAASSPDPHPTLREHATRLIDIMSELNASVGRINQPSLAAMATVMTDLARHAHEGTLRAMADSAAATAEELGMVVCTLRNATGAVIRSMEEIVRQERPAPLPRQPTSLAPARSYAA